MKYNKLSDNDFTKAAAFFTSDKAIIIADDFFQFAIESCLRYVEHGEVSHLNTMLLGAVNMKQAPLGKALAKQVAAHDLLKNGKYKVGKADSKKLVKLRKNVTRITRTLESMIKESTILKAAKAKAKAEAVYDGAAQAKTIKLAVSKLVTAQLDDDTIIAMVRIQLEAVRADAVTTVVDF